MLEYNLFECASTAYVKRDKPSMNYSFHLATLYRKGDSKNFRSGSFDYKLRVLAPFVRMKSDCRAIKLFALFYNLFPSP